MIELYKEIFNNKVRKRSNVYTETKQEHIDGIMNILEEKNIKVSNNINKDINKDIKKDIKKFDYIILENALNRDIFTNNILSEYRNILEDDGILMFINEIAVKSNYCLVEKFIDYLYTFTGLDLKIVNIGDLYTIFYEKQLRIIDVYRLFSESNIITYKEIYLISCVIY